ncbi:sugar phosphate isomerase/epimerase family protein [Agromyces sp. NPDC058126]|uniref:sugar phosphate isomerase/epimerase family protein n=1 Tax=Agromyces sp. NPDC058126 TaxID=3346350 RepID=UPI0036DB968D
MPDWGSGLGPSELPASAVAAGYDGVELWWPVGRRAQGDLADAVATTGASLALLVTSAAEDPGAHADEIEQQIEEIDRSGLPAEHVTLHLGRDHWDVAVHHELAERVVGWRRRFGRSILVELHRGRMLHSAHHSLALLAEHPELRVTFDISHWIVVAESMLDDQQAAVDLAIARADHVHARIGHPQGPQVASPVATDTAIVERHFAWWGRVVDRIRSEGRRPTLLAEFGPVPYAPARRDGRAVVDPARSNRWIMGEVRRRY